MSESVTKLKMPPNFESGSSATRSPKALRAARVSNDLRGVAALDCA